MPWRLRSRLALVLAVAMAPAGLVAVLQALGGAENEIRQRDAVFVSEMRATALRQRDALLRVRSALAEAADEAETQYLESGNCTAALSRLSLERYFGGAVLLNRDGRPVCGTGDGEPLAPPPPTWERFVADPDPTFSIAGPVDETGMWPVLALHPTVFRRPEAFAVAAEIDLAYLRALSLEAAPAAAYGVIDSSGGLITDSAEDGRDWLPGDPNAILSSLRDSVTAVSQRGVERIYMVQQLIDGQLWAVASIPKTTFLQVMRSPAGVTVLVPVLLWLIAVLVAYVSIDKLVTRHIAHLARAASQIGRGDLEPEIRPLRTAPVEIRALGDAIRDMARNLQERDTETRELIEHQKNLILEIHHRVKNNLQMVTSLINIQLRRAKTADERQALRFLEDRVQSLAIVHHHLYGTEELDQIDLGELVRDICERLKLSMTPVGANVALHYDLDAMTVDSRIATPVALFVTEAVSNVFKHAVPQTGRHVIQVDLRTEGPRFVLAISNAMTHVIEPEPVADQQQRLGMRLLRSFAAQLDGTFEKSVADGRFRLVLSAPILPRGSNVVAPAFSAASR